MEATIDATTVVSGQPDASGDRSPLVLPDNIDRGSTAAGSIHSMVPASGATTLEIPWVRPEISKPRCEPSSACLVAALVTASRIPDVVREGISWLTVVQSGLARIDDGTHAGRPRGYPSEAATLTAAFRYLILRAEQPLEVEEARQCVLLLLLALNPTFDEDVPEFGIKTLWAPRANVAGFNFVRNFRKHGLNRAVLLEDAMDFVEQTLVPPGESWRRLKTLAEAVCRRLGVAVRVPAARTDEPQLTPLQFHIVRLISQSASPIPGVQIEILVRPHGASSWVREALGELHLRMRVLENDDQAYSLITASGR